MNKVRAVIIIFCIFIITILCGFTGKEAAAGEGAKFGMAAAATAGKDDKDNEEVSEEILSARQLNDMRAKRSSCIAGAGARVEPYYKETLTESHIFSYVQVKEPFYDNTLWTGKWADITAGGQKLMSFGCGLCCLSNILSTFSGEPFTPDQVYHLAKDKVRYNPDSGRGAIDWGQMTGILDLYGYPCEVLRKPRQYSDFQSKLAASDAVVVLVCKDNDDSLWWYTNGHYVTLWEYDAATDTVFLTDSSGLYNRARVPLQYIYDALKTSSMAQVMTVMNALPSRNRNLLKKGQ